MGDFKAAVLRGCQQSYCEQFRMLDPTLNHICTLCACAHRYGNYMTIAQRRLLARAEEENRARIQMVTDVSGGVCQSAGGVPEGMSDGLMAVYPDGHRCESTQGGCGGQRFGLMVPDLSALGRGRQSSSQAQKLL
jgi:hypothetical protein